MVPPVTDTMLDLVARNAPLSYSRNGIGEILVERLVASIEGLEELAVLSGKRVSLMLGRTAHFLKKRPASTNKFMVFEGYEVHLFCF